MRLFSTWAGKAFILCQAVLLWDFFIAEPSLLVDSALHLVICQLGVMIVCYASANKEEIFL